MILSAGRSLLSAKLCMVSRREWRGALGSKLLPSSRSRFSRLHNKETTHGLVLDPNRVPRFFQENGMGSVETLRDE